MRRKWVKRVVGLLAVLAVAGVLVYEITKPRSMHEVIEAVTAYSLPRADPWRDSPRIVAVCGRYPVWVFKVVNEQSGKESIIGYGELNERTLRLRFSNVPSAPAAALFDKSTLARLGVRLSPKGELSEEEARERTTNLRDITIGMGEDLEDEVEYAAWYPEAGVSLSVTVTLWCIAVKRGWFKADERSAIMLIYNKALFDGRLDFLTDFSSGYGPPDGGYYGFYPMGQINARTLEIEPPTSRD